MNDANQRRWWSRLVDEECPITLEPISALPYPPFTLSGGGAAGAAGNHEYHFDGLALATYVVSRGAFANPMTREPLDYGCCVRLDEFLDEHVYGKGDRRCDRPSSSILGPGRRLSVKEAWALRGSMKIKVAGGGGDGRSESDLRRAEALRNEATAALTGLFVFGHRSEGHRQNDNRWESEGQAANSRTLAGAPGGFNLWHKPDTHSEKSWGMSSNGNQGGLRIIDDDEAAHEAADIAAWRGVQAEFPHLGNSTSRQALARHSGNDDNIPSRLLETVRQTAILTSREEKEESERVERQRDLQFLKALERKRNRINARRKAKLDAADELQREKQAREELKSAREEIDRWRARQWEQWERVAATHESETKANDSRPKPKTPAEIDEPKQETRESTPPNQGPTPEERAARAAAKKRAKKQRAKERAKEKKRLERLGTEKKERALALQRRKEASAAKCRACGDGILGCGFEKFGVKFCSPKCARKGPFSEH